MNGFQVTLSKAFISCALFTDKQGVNAASVLNIFALYIEIKWLTSCVEGLMLPLG